MSRGFSLVALVACAVGGWVGCGSSARPVAHPGEERTVKVGEVVQFDGSASTGEISSYVWDFGDGSDTKTGAHVEHTFTREGDFSVSLTVRGPGGGDTSAAIVHVGKGCLPTAVLTVVTNNPLPGAPVHFSAGSSTACAQDSLASYRWEFGDGETVEGADRAIVSHTYAMKGTYPVALEVFSASGAKGRATRTLNVGVMSGKPTVQCSGPQMAQTGKPATYTAQAQDPGGGTIAEYAWTFSDDGSTALGASATHTFAAAGSFSAQVTAKTEDGRTSDPCTVAVTVSAPPNYSGTWLLNPASTSINGSCTKFTVPFPATHLQLTHDGATLDGVPSGNGWPSGSTLVGEEDDTAPGTWRIRGDTPEQDKTSAGCGPVVPDHSVELKFNSSTTLSGTWKVLYNFPCVGNGCSATCNCIASGTFSGIKQ